MERANLRASPKSFNLLRKLKKACLHCLLLLAAYLSVCLSVSSAVRPLFSLAKCKKTREKKILLASGMLGPSKNRAFHYSTATTTTRNRWKCCPKRKRLIYYVFHQTIFFREKRLTDFFEKNDFYSPIVTNKWTGKITKIGIGWTYFLAVQLWWNASIFSFKKHVFPKSNILQWTVHE